MNDAEKIVQFIDYAEKLKTELRYASKSNNERESVAEHSWRMSLMLLLVSPKLKVKIDLLKALKMSLIHDLVEIDAKDVPVIIHITDEKIKEDINKKEKAAIEKISQMLGESGDEIKELWLEFEEQKTNEARVVRAIDKLEGQMQFLNDNVTKFEKSEEITIRKILNETVELSKVDPLLIEIDKLTMPARLKRTGLK